MKLGQGMMSQKQAEISVQMKVMSCLCFECFEREIEGDFSCQIEMLLVFAGLLYRTDWRGQWKMEERMPVLI